MTPDWSVLQNPRLQRALSRTAPPPKAPRIQREAAERKTEEVLRIFKAYVREEHEMPTIRELQSRTGISSSSSVVYHLARLVRRGDLEQRGRSTARGYRLVVRPGEPCPFCGAGGEHDAG